ncbi:MAG: hypothetical protein PVH61_03110 [Candidatus Aminicenantes bacterium]
MQETGSNTNAVTKAEMEQYFSKMMEIRLKQAMEEFIARNDVRIKELSLIERIVRVEDELKALREISEAKFDASEKRFELLQTTMYERFEALQREMNARFEAVDKRFEAMDKRFSAVQWMIGIMVGVPALFIAVNQLIQMLK